MIQHGARTSAYTEARRRSFRALLLAAVLAFAGAPLLGGPLFTTIPAVEMVHDQLGGKVLPALGGGGWSAYCESYCELVADARLPHGARIDSIEIDACRDAAGDRPIGFALVRRLQNDTGGVEKLEVVVEGTVNTTGCTWRVAAPGSVTVVNSWGYEYLVFVTMGSLLCGGLGGDPCPDSGSRFQSMRVYYEPPFEGVVVPSSRSGSE
jgi:hypothetical protein